MVNIVGLSHRYQLPVGYARIYHQSKERKPRDPYPYASDNVERFSRINLLLSISVLVGASSFFVGLRLNFYGVDHILFRFQMIGWMLMMCSAPSSRLAHFLCFLLNGFSHDDNTVPQKYPLTSSNYWGTVKCIGRTNMANVLSTEKQVAVIGALAEGSGIRSDRAHDGRSPRNDHAAWRARREGLRSPPGPQDARSVLPASPIR